jgi:hypothetical protein
MSEVNITSSAPLQEALEEMNLEREEHRRPFDEEYFLSLNGGLYEIKVDIIGFGNKVLRQDTFYIPRQMVLDRSRQLFQEWLAAGRKDLRGVLNTALYQVVQEEKKKYLATFRKPKKKSKNYTVNPL